VRKRSGLDGVEKGGTRQGQRKAYVLGGALESEWAMEGVRGLHRRATRAASRQGAGETQGGRHVSLPFQPYVFSGEIMGSSPPFPANKMACGLFLS
jgi:hypothetical protein